MHGNSLTNFNCLCEVLLNNSQLEILNLGWNIIQNEGLIKICDALKTNKSIKKLYLSSSQISQVDCLREVFLRNSILEILDLFFNEINNEGLKEICNGLKATKTIKQL